MRTTPGSSWRSVCAAVAALAAGACSGRITAPGEQGGGAGGAGVGGGSGGGVAPLVCKPGVVDVPAAPLRRLTRQEYANSLRDLLGLDSVAVDDVPTDESAGPFASNTVTALTDLAAQQYMDSAERLARAAVANVDRLVACDRAAAGDAACAGQFIDRFGARAFRRPLADEERTRYLALYQQYAAGGGFAGGVRVVLQTILQSPSFLYHVELDAGPPVARVAPLTPHELAARLSFFIWNSVPDDALLAAASSGSLGDVAGLRAEAQRMLQDRRAADAIASFHLQWLDLGKLPSLTRDATLYPKFAADPQAARTAMQAETVAFARHVLLEGDGRFETLLTAPYSILDGPLFDLYGVARPAGSTGAVVVQLDPRQRAGLLTQPAFLASHAHENQTSPVARGVAIRRNILCESLPDPPPNVNNAPPDPMPGATTRQRLLAHEQQASCAACHTLIDGIGLGFEAYDAVGAFRATDQGQAVDATGSITGAADDLNGAFDGAVELAHKLAASTEAQQCLARQWFRFALGRLEGQSDACSLRGVFQAFDDGGHDVRQLVSAIVASDAFRYRRVVTP